MSKYLDCLTLQWLAVLPFWQFSDENISGDEVFTSYCIYKDIFSVLLDLGVFGG